MTDFASPGSRPDAAGASDAPASTPTNAPSRKITRSAVLTVAGLALFALSLLTKVVLVRHELLSPGSLTSMGFAIDIAFVGLVTALVALTRRPLWWAVTVDVLLSVMLFGALVYVSYFDQLPMLSMLALSKQLGDVDASVADLIRPAYFLMLADIVVLAAMALFAGRSPAKPKALKIVLASVATACLAVVLVASVSVAGLRGSIDSIETARRLGLMGWTAGSSFRPTEAAAMKIEPAQVAAMQAKIDKLAGVEETRVAEAPKPGAAKHMNVIVIQVEALQTLAMDRQIDGKDITPNLNAFAKKSYFFPNTISQTSRGLTADAEFISATSMFPPNGEPSAVTMATKTLPSLQRKLGEEGYRTATMHVNRVNFWNRVQLYPAIGYQKYYDRQYYGEEDTIYLGQSDELFFKNTMPIIQKLDAGKKPFFAQLVTISSHHPFPQLPADKHPIDVPAELQGNIAGRYVQDINYADRAIGEFLTDLERQGILDDTIVVIYGDHFAIKPSQKDPADKAAVMSFGGTKYSNLDAIRIPLIIHLPKQAQGMQIDQLNGQADIGPTIAELLGVDYGAARPLFGASVFRVRTDNVVPSSCLAPYGTFVTPAGQYRVGMGSKGAKLTKTNGDARKARAEDQPYFDRAEQLRELNDSFAASLPTRPGAGKMARGAKLPPVAQQLLDEGQ